MQQPSAPRTGHLLLDIVTHQADFLDAARIPRHAADGADFAIVIDHADIAFGGAVKFHDARDAEAGLEARPDFRPQIRCRWRCVRRGRARAGAAAC